MDLIVSSLRQGNAPVDPAQVAQFIFRAGDEINKFQMDLLREFPTPNILIATPAKILEMLSSEEERPLLNISFVRTVVVDEVDRQLKLNVIKMNASKRKRSAHSKRRINLAMDYITKLRKEALRVYSLDLPLVNVVLSSAVSIGDAVYKNVMNSGWMKGASVKSYGAPGLNKHTPAAPNVKTKYMNVVEKTSMSKILDSKSGWKPYSKLFDEISASITLRHVKTMLAEQEESDIKKSLVLVPDSASKTKLIALIKELGRTASVIDAFAEPNNAETVSDFAVLDPQTMFLKETNDSSNVPDFIISGVLQANGLHFAGLSRIYVLSASALIQICDPTEIKFLCRPVSAHMIEQLAFANPSKNGTDEAPELAKVTYIV